MLTKKPVLTEFPAAAAARWKGRKQRAQTVQACSVRQEQHLAARSRMPGRGAATLGSQQAFSP